MVKNRNDGSSKFNSNTIDMPVGNEKISSKKLTPNILQSSPWAFKGSPRLNNVDTYELDCNMY